ncbi:putative glycosyltransferase family 2 [groundwater metagenome]|uniref:Putative glycosyltransferase family 2 n=1 Tax=groundwater metagenome TaxID=717931 RepID=A0A098EFQ3_9ZZZZ
MLLEILYIIFGISVFGLFWTYAGYPIFIWILAKIIEKEHRYDKNYQPNVTLVIPCYNEEGIIKKKLENTLGLNYPKENLEILVVDDNSKDNTSKIVEKFMKEKKTENIFLLRQEREGKNAAINNGLKHTKNEIIIISDANAFLDKNALKYCLRHFSDEKVGCVGAQCVHKIHMSTGESIGTAFYLESRNFLYENEDKIHCAQVASGWLQVFRVNFLNPTEQRTFSAEDVDMMLSIKQKRFEVIYESLAIAQKYTVDSIRDLFNQKRRQIFGIIQTYVKRKIVLNPLKYGWFSISFFSNRLLPTLTPFFILGIFFSSYGIYHITSSELFYYFVLLQLTAFFIGFAIIVISTLKEITMQPFSTIKFFTLMQIIILIAWIDYFRRYKQPSTTWETIQNLRKFKDE